MTTGECRDVDPEITGTCPVRAFMEGLIGALGPSIRADHACDDDVADAGVEISPAAASGSPVTPAEDVGSAILLGAPPLPAITRPATRGKRSSRQLPERHTHRHCADRRVLSGAAEGCRRVMVPKSLRQTLGSISEKTACADEANPAALPRSSYLTHAAGCPHTARLSSAATAAGRGTSRAGELGSSPRPCGAPGSGAVMPRRWSAGTSLSPPN